MTAAWLARRPGPVPVPQLVVIPRAKRFASVAREQPPRAVSASQPELPAAIRRVPADQSSTSDRKRVRATVGRTAIASNRVQRHRDDTPPILIELDTETSGGFIHDRFDVQLRGRVAAGLPIEALELFADERAVSRIDYGQPHRAPATTLPDGTPGRERMFQFNLPREPAEAEGVCNLRLRAIEPGRPGATRNHSPWRLTRPAREPVRVVSGPQRPLARPGEAARRSSLYVERAAIDADGALLVHGWAVAMNPVVTVQAFLADQRLARRADLAGCGTTWRHTIAGYPNARPSGFMLTAQLGQRPGQARERVRVQAISRNGFSHEVLVPLERTSTNPSRQPRRRMAGWEFVGADRMPTGGSATGAPSADRTVPRFTPCRPEPHADPKPHDDPHREIRYFCDEALFRPDGTLRVVGWASVPPAWRKSPSRWMASGSAWRNSGLPRPDVGEEFADNPAAQFAGFRFEQAVSRTSPKASISCRLLVRNAAWRRAERNPAAARHKPVPPAPADGAGTAAGRDAA